MNILAMDTSGAVLSVALSSPDGVRLTETASSTTSSSELLMEMVDGLFRSAGLGRGDLELAACMRGPGSFTGLRIGYAAAKGLSLALGIPVAAVPTLDCIAHHLSVWPGLVLAAMDAKKSCFFAALYRGGARLGEYLDADPGALSALVRTQKSGPDEPLILTGPGAEMLFPLLAVDIQEGAVLDPLPGPGSAGPGRAGPGRALELLDISGKNSIEYKLDKYAGPLYLRKSDAELAAKV